MPRKIDGIFFTIGKRNLPIFFETSNIVAYVIKKVWRSLGVIAIACEFGFLKKQILASNLSECLIYVSRIKLTGI